VQYGFRAGNSLRPYGRSYVRCQCGVPLSGNGSDGGHASWRKHLARRLAVAP
jgi:hypothetical protein